MVIKGFSLFYSEIIRTYFVEGLTNTQEGCSAAPFLSKPLLSTLVTNLNLLNCMFLNNELRFS